VAAIEVRHKSYFKAQLIRAVYQMGTSEWKRVKSNTITRSFATFGVFADKTHEQPSS